jgi:guanylate kinase
MDGNLIIFSAPSGTGKTTIVKHLIQANLQLEFSVSATSRQKRNNEQDGKDYYFFTPEVFKEKIDNNEFLEWEEVYPKQFYGTLFTELDRIFGNNHHALFDVDVFGGLRIKEKYPDNSLAIFLIPPSMEVLRERLLLRGTETEDSFRKRESKASLEMQYKDRFDAIIINDDLHTAQEEACRIVRDFLKIKTGS